MDCAVVVAAGRAARMGGGDKNMLPLLGKPALRRSLEALMACGDIGRVVVVTAEERMAEYAERIDQWGLPVPVTVVAGGSSRGRSVYCGLKALPEDCEAVAIHDAARPFVTAEIVEHTLQSARLRGSGVAAVKARDTMKVAPGGLVQSTPDRDLLWMVQTPQSFRYPLILSAYEAAFREGAEATDDAAVLERCGGTVHLVEGSYDNIKLTTPEDIAHGEAILRRRGEGKAAMARIGEGYDAHLLVAGRRLILGGVDVPHKTGLLGHSDADVLVHAVMDALLGAAGLGDIGRHFPDSSAEFEGISSLELLRRVAALLEARGWAIGNVDATVVAQRPKIAGFIPQMAANIAQCLAVGADQVNVKATTTEGLGFEGRQEGVSARAVALLERRS